ncbi:MAG: hypothetical protein CMIDDMOC_00839 [Sodalis sp. Fle]|nr:MAG: hypothetical protein CMIDDMOC_00839 [Sodalis sp. Fle]
MNRSNHDNVDANYILIRLLSVSYVKNIVEHTIPFVASMACQIILNNDKLFILMLDYYINSYHLAIIKPNCIIT